MTIPLNQPIPIGSTNWGDLANANWKTIQDVLNSSCERNKIINRKFDLWQRGTTFTSIGSTAYSADRWIYESKGTMVTSPSHDTDVPSLAQAGILTNYSIHIP